MSGQIFTVPFSFTSRDGVSRVSATLWTCEAFGSPDKPGEQKPKGIVQIVHGMTEYVGRYDELARYLVDRGFIVCGEDHVGHGKTAASPEDFGHISVKEGKDILLSDVHTLRQKVQECFADVPYIMYGHSMGSFMTRCYIARHGEGLAACVLTGTGNMPVIVSKAGRLLSQTLAAVRGERFKSAFVHNLGVGSYSKQIEDAKTPLDWLAANEQVVRDYSRDSMCGFMFTVGGYATLLHLTAECATPACAAKVPKDLPILLLAGSEDPVGDKGKGVLAAADLLRDAGVRKVDMKLYKGMRHEIHNEEGREQVFDDIASWIEKVLD